MLLECYPDRAICFLFNQGWLLNTFTDQRALISIILDNVIQIAKNKENCLFLQDLILKVNQLEFALIADSIVANLFPIVVHKIGNFLVSKAARLMNESKLTSLLIALESIDVNIFCMKEASLCIQKIMGFVKTAEQIKILNSLIERYFLLNCLDKEGVYVLSCFLYSFNRKITSSSFISIIKNAALICRLRYSPQILKSFLYLCSEYDFSQFLFSIFKCCPELLLNEFGCHFPRILLTIKPFNRIYLLLFQQVRRYLNALILNWNGVIVLETMINFETPREMSVLRKELLLPKYIMKMMSSAHCFSLLVKILEFSTIYERNYLLNVRV